MNDSYKPQPGSEPAPPSPARPPSRTLTRARILWMTQTAILTALLLVMSYTPLGYLPLGPMKISLLTLPVVVGAIVVGPSSGAFLGLVFGLTSLAQCFGADPLGTMLFTANPFFTAVLCIVPRVLMGWLTALVFRALHRIDRTRLVSYAVASLSGALLNTILFLGALALLFGSFDWQGSFVGMGLWPLLLAIVTVNAPPEAVVVLLAGTAITKGLRVAMGDRKKPKAA